MDDSENARDCLGHARVTTVCVHTSMDMEQQSDHKQWDGVIGLFGRVAPLVSPWCARGNMPTGVNLNRYGGPRSCIRWYSDNESLFGPPNQPKAIRWSSRFVAHRVMCPLRSRRTMVTSWSWMVQRDWSIHIARCLGCRVLGLTLRVVGSHTQHATKVEPSRVPEALVQPSSRKLGEGENKLIPLWGLVLLLSILVFYLLVNTWIHIWGRRRRSCRRPAHLAVHFPCRGKCSLGWETALASVTTLPLSKEKVFLFPFKILSGCKNYALFREVWHNRN